MAFRRQRDAQQALPESRDDALPLPAARSPQIKEVMSRLPLRHQTLLFSATMPREIEALAQAYLQHPVTIKASGAGLSCYK